MQTGMNPEGPIPVCGNNISASRRAPACLAESGRIAGPLGWQPGRAYRQATFAAGLAGFGCAIGVHYIEGYTDVTHLAPAILGAFIFLSGTTCEVIDARRSQSVRDQPRK